MASRRSCPVHHLMVLLGYMVIRVLGNNAKKWECQQWQQDCSCSQQNEEIVGPRGNKQCNGCEEHRAQSKSRQWKGCCCTSRLGKVQGGCCESTICQLVWTSILTSFDRCCKRSTAAGAGEEGEETYQAHAVCSWSSIICYGLSSILNITLVG